MLSTWLLRSSWVLFLALGSVVPISALPAEPIPFENAASRPQKTRLPDPTDLGVVWTPPVRPDSALRALNRIHAVGATAVRLTRPPLDTVAARADTLGLSLYVDLPVAPVAAPRLSDVLEEAKLTLDRILALHRQYASVTHVGLARSADTTVPTACAVLDRWTERIHAKNSSLQTYYVTPFPASTDRCAEAVDVVLLDVRDLPAPVDRWRRWQSQKSKTGLGALGTWVRPEAPSGLKIPHSPERQARHLEEALSRFLDSTRAVPPAVFVSRWQDRPSPLLPSHRYGLHTLDGASRPAANVVQGFYMGSQRVFAFPSGSTPADSYGLLLLSWGLVALLGGLYAQSLFVRQTVTRYFMAHGFYRDALREGRDLNPGMNGTLLGVVTVALGTTGILAARLAATRAPTQHVLAALPPDLGVLLAGGLEQPAMVGPAVGGLVLVGLLIWMAVLVLVARRWTRFSFSQGLTLVVWPCWPTLLALPCALASGPHSPLSPSFLAFFLLAGSALILVYFTVRVLLDYQAVTGLPWAMVAPLTALSPLALTLGSVTTIVWQYDLPLLFLWRLCTQT